MPKHDKLRQNERQVEISGGRIKVADFGITGPVHEIQKRIDKITVYANNRQSEYK